MRRIVLALMSTVTAVVLLFGYRTSTAHPAAAVPAAVAAGSAGTGGSGTASGSSTSTTPAAPQPSSSASSSSTSSSGTASAASSTKTVTGQTSQTRWGPVQVQITVSGGKVTAVNLLQVPSGNGRDVEINNQAVPVLKQETLAAQNANIDSVSGATVTSDGYVTSLQSALNQAGL